MGESNWEEERKSLLERLHNAEKIAAESQAEAAVYRRILEDWYDEAQKALKKEDVLLLNNFIFPVREIELEKWGKSFLESYMINATWLEDAKKALEIIKSEVKKLAVEDDTDNKAIKRKILEAIEFGLAAHLIEWEN